MLTLNPEDTIYAKSKIVEAYSRFSRIDDYFRFRKIDRIRKMPATLDGYGWEDELFSDFSMHPRDMDFRLRVVSQKRFHSMLEIVSSFCVESNPGRNIKLVIEETNTNKAVGMIKLASPLIGSNPRNQWLGEVPDFKRYNQHAMMGLVIVPAQPFGFNYLGGKLLSLICCSHEAREMFNEQYDMNVCIFETTSLYGNIKGTSQYDGLKPYIRYLGDTLSDFLPMMPDENYFELREWFAEKNGGEYICTDATNNKLKTHKYMIDILTRSIREHFPEQLDEFKEFVVKTKNITTKKRFYMSDFGFANSRDVLLGRTDELVKNPVNYDKFYMANLIEWWRRKASNRYERLTSEGGLRTELEVWNERTMDSIDIIR